MSKCELSTIVLDGVEYVRADSLPQHEPAETLDGLEYCMVRTYSAGVFAGYVKERKGKEAMLLNARRIWYWSGAASLSQLATDGTSKPDTCKFPCEVSKVELTEVVEVIPITKKAQASIKAVKIWQQ